MSIVTPRDLITTKKNLALLDQIEIHNITTGQNEKILARSVTRNFQGDDIATTDILISVNGIVDSQNNKVIQKQISWIPYKAWKDIGVTGDLRFARGEVGIFGEYENLWQDPVLTDVDVIEVGFWDKVENNTTVAGSLIQNLATAQTEGVFTFKAKKGSEDLIRFIMRIDASNNIVEFTFSTAVFNITAGSFDSNTSKEIVAGEEYEITLIKTGNFQAGDYVRVYASPTSGVSEYTYYKEISYVQNISYPVPYVKGIHTADSWVHPVNWNESTDWTIDFWLKPEVDEGWVFDARGGVGDDGFTILFSGGNLFARGYSGGVATSVIFSTQPAIGSYNHIKIVYESASQIRAYLDSSLVATVSTNVPVSTAIPPVITFGSLYDLSSLFINGYFTSPMIRPSADVSTTHYDLGLPWTNPENVINTEHGAYQDKYGNIVGETFTANEEDAYSVVEQYTIGDQTVTKWSNGDMEIRGIITYSGVGITVTVGSLFRNGSSTAVQAIFLENFITVPVSSVILHGLSTFDEILIKSYSATVSLINTILFANISIASSSGQVGYISKGTWK